MKENSTFQSFTKSPYFSIKHTNYFEVYDKLMNKFVGEPITFVEIGILDGGSLFMWQDFFGKNARIIGVDLNPEATKWREHGFEIFIGDQSDSNFGQNFSQRLEIFMCFWMMVGIGMINKLLPQHVHSPTF